MPRCTRDYGRREKSVYESRINARRWDEVAPDPRERGALLLTGSGERGDAPARRARRTARWAHRTRLSPFCHFRRVLVTEGTAATGADSTSAAARTRQRPG